ncbi:MAG: hypothetical protein L0287_35630, partial [Anaerolineae bacterium]|nr:hypothetical protein [Anaerolineae bacterium]
SSLFFTSCKFIHVLDDALSDSLLDLKVLESPFLVQFWCSWDRNYGFIGQVGRKPPNFVE